ncbi:DUF7344 domain-containing protein [Halosimplex amylolyticum]|uniref:DUF7344 domain-containing protein n=1 Tax=Halosimplex amylolyticum TaxID=3396616 RepID=UPI003F57EACF
MTEDEYHELLSVERRRTTLDILAGSTAPVELEELATTVAARESDVRVPDEATTERVAINLHHNHLPKMANLGLIAYDPDSSRVELCP